jgi:hypothetical protein
MSTTKKNDIPPEKLKLYEKLAGSNPDIERKGATVPYTSLNGNMFSYLHSSGAMALRLPTGEREKFLAKYKTKLFEAYGIVQKEYVTVPDALLAKTNELKPYFEISYESAKSLRPKPTKKKG